MHSLTLWIVFLTFAVATLKYTAERNYQKLMEVYQLAIERRQRR